MTKTLRGFAAIGLCNPKTPANVGGAMRAADCYGAALIVKTGSRYARCPADVTAAYRHIPLLQVSNLRDAIPHDCVPVAIDLLEDARSLFEFTHPERAFYIFGPEDGTLGRAVTDWCKHKVYVPTRHCMNLAATVNVVLYDRAMKQART